MMDSPRIRIGWLKMLLGVLARTGGRAHYDELIGLIERFIADAEREAGDVR